MAQRDEADSGRAVRLGEALDARPSLTPGNTSGSRPSVPTGFVDLDGLTGGMRPGDLWVVTGRSGAGKSVLVLDFARSAAIRHAAPTGHLRARERLEDIVAQIVSAQGRVPLHHLRSSPSEEDRQRVLRQMPVLAEVPLWLAATVEYGEAALPTASEQVAGAVAMLEERDLALLIVDDVPAGITFAQLQELKLLAVRAGTCVVAVVLDGPERPGDEVERDAAVAADVVLRVARDHDMTPGSEDPRAGEADLLVLRHRRGPIAAVTVAFQGHYARFVDVAFG